MNSPRFETPLYIPCGKQKLFGVLHEPTEKSPGKGIVFCHPFAEEKLWAHRVFVNFARLLAGEGYSVLRFDFMGNGDSQGDFAGNDIKGYLRDIQTAIAYLESTGKCTQGIDLVGLRLGATLACMTAEQTPRLTRLILWDPIVQGARYMKEMLRINIATQSAVYKEIRHNTEALVGMMKVGKGVNVDGYEVHWPLHLQVSEIDLASEPKSFSGQVLIVQINQQKGQGCERLKALADCYRHADLREAMEEQFWKEIKRYYERAENLFDVTLDWMRTR